MKKFFVLLVALMPFVLIDVAAQSKVMKVSAFKFAENDFTAQKDEYALTFPDEYTKEDRICPIIKVRYPTNDELNFEGKYQEAKKIGSEYWVYVFDNTKSLKIFDTSRKALPVVVTFSDLGFKSLQEGMVYILTLAVEEIHDITSLSSSVTLGLGWNDRPEFGGPYLSVGYNYKQLGIEVEASMVGGESGFVYFKGKPYEDSYGWHDDDAWTRSFDPYFQAAARLGYDIRLASRLAITPQIGATILYMEECMAPDRNSEIPSDVKYLEGFTRNDEEYFDKLFSIGGTVGTRLMLMPFGKRFRLQVTPYYKFAVSNTELIEELSKYDENIKQWVEGFGFTAGMLFYF